MKNHIKFLNQNEIKPDYSQEELQILFDLFLLDDDDNWPMFCLLKEKEESHYPDEEVYQKYFNYQNSRFEI